MPSFDRAALRAMYAANPLPPLPPGLRQTESDCPPELFGVANETRSPKFADDDRRNRDRLDVRHSSAQNELYLEITQPGLRRVAVAAPPLMVSAGTPADASKDFQETLDNDLAAAAPIALVDTKLYVLVEDDPRPEILNQRWRAIGAQFLLSGTLVRAGGQLVVEARLVDLVSGEFAFAKRYRAGITASQVVAHTLANDIVQVFKWRPGPFLSRIGFISDRAGGPEVWVMDWDGANPKQLTKHGAIALAPAWSPDGRRMVFTSFLRGSPALFVLTPQEGYLRLLWDKGGVNSLSASFSPDGKTSCLCIERGRQHRYLCYRHRGRYAAATHHRARHRHSTGVGAQWPPDRLYFHPVGESSDLSDGCRWFQCSSPDL